jgi:hypothetical protein
MSPSLTEPPVGSDFGTPVEPIGRFLDSDGPILSDLRSETPQTGDTGATAWADRPMIRWLDGPMARSPGAAIWRGKLAATAHCPAPSAGSSACLGRQEGV